MTIRPIKIPRELITALSAQQKLTFGNEELLKKPPHLVQGLREEFAKSFGRAPNDDDPICYDPQQPTPVAKSLETMLADLAAVALNPDLEAYIDGMIKDASQLGQTVQ